MKVHYLGPSGTFSEQAATWLAERVKDVDECRAAPSISEAFSAAGDTGLAVVPVSYTHLTLPTSG